MDDQRSGAFTAVLAASPSPPPEDQPAGPEPHILIVEDEPGVSELVQFLLEDKGYSVETAGDGRTALARIEAGAVDLVVLDLLLPQMDGYEVCRRVREGEQRGHLPILMLTGLSNDAEQLAGFDAGCDDYVTKPFRAQELVARVERLLQRASGLAR